MGKFHECARPLPIAILVLAGLNGCNSGTSTTRLAQAGPPESPAAPAHTPGPSPTVAPSRLSSLPRHLGLGLANGPGDLPWMTNPSAILGQSDSRIPWDYRYQYLAGGVDIDGNDSTGPGWAYWNWPKGQFALDYMNASASAGIVPVLTYYMILQSQPANSAGLSESQAVLRNLSNPATMAAYFSDWKTLMQKAGESGHTVIIHHEPDAWGYMQAQYGDDPALTPVSVASSGFSEAAGFENNARGLARALIALRDAYAPNALIAWHASAWASGTDLTYSNADGAAVAGHLASFFNRLQADFDLIFYDPSDRDSAFYQYVYGDTSGNRWWDAADFSRYRDYIASVTVSTGRKGMLWQVPIGNTLYKSCNNTWEHYQDNRVEYFLKQGNSQHIADYARAGIIAILFGRGADGPSNYADSAGDGITNPAPINGNVLDALYPDDDGGFLRISASAYYAGGPQALP